MAGSGLAEPGRLKRSKTWRSFFQKAGHLEQPAQQLGRLWRGLRGPESLPRRLAGPALQGFAGTWQAVQSG